MATLTISCDDCRMHDTPACHECVVTFLCDPVPVRSLSMDTAEVRALRLLGRSGLVPPLRHQPFEDRAEAG